MLSLVFAVDIAFYLFMKLYTKSTYVLNANVFYFSLGLIVFYLGTQVFTKNANTKIDYLNDNIKTRITFIYKMVLMVFYYLLIMQFFTEQYASHVSYWVQVVFWLFIASRTNIFYKKSC